MNFFETSRETSQNSLFKLDLPLKNSTRSSFGSIHLSPIGSPKSTESKLTYNFSESNLSIEKQEINAKLSVNKVKSFHRIYLDKGMWPDIDPKDQAKFKTEYRELKTKISEKREKIKGLKKVIVTERENCSNCAEWKKKNEATQSALKEAVELSTLLLRGIKKG